MMLLLALLTAAYATRPAALEPRLEPLQVEHGLPALGAVVVQDGRPVAFGVVGQPRAGEGEALLRNARWHLGSDTQAMTATLLAILVDQELLGWNTTVGEVLGPVWPRMDPGWRDVTLEQLLRHTAGAPEALPAGLMLRLYSLEERGRDARRLLVKKLLSEPPESDPGTHWAPSGAGYVLAGAMAEQVTGQSWEALMQAELFEPLGMTRSGFGAPTQRKDPRGHTCRGGRQVPVESFGIADSPAATGPAGTVHAPLDDWARFAALHAGAGPALLKPETMAILHTPTKHSGEPPYAMGWWVLDDGTLVASGSNTLWYAAAWVSPAEGLAVLAATNTACGGAEEVVDTLGSALLSERREALRQSAALLRRAEVLDSPAEARAEYGVTELDGGLIIPRSELPELLPRELVFLPRRSDDGWEMLGYSAERWPLWRVLGISGGAILTRLDGRALDDVGDLEALMEALYTADQLTLEVMDGDRSLRWELQLEGPAIAAPPRVSISTNMRELALEQGAYWDHGVLTLPRELLDGLRSGPPDRWHSTAAGGLRVCTLRLPLRYLDLRDDTLVTQLNGEPMTPARLPALYRAVASADALTLQLDEGRELRIALEGPPLDVPPDWAAHQGLISPGDTALWLPEEIENLAIAAPIGARWEVVAAGLQVTELEPTGLLAHTGLLDGDIITHCDGQPLRSVDDLRTLAAALRPGGPVSLRIQRGDQVVSVIWQRAM